MTALVAIVILLNFIFFEQPLARRIDTHVVPLEEVRRELLRRSSRRTANIQKIQKLLRHKAIQTQVGKLADLKKIEVALASLDDETLEELAHKSRKINDQLRAGDPITWVVITLVVLLIVIVLAALVVGEAKKQLSR